MSATRTDVLDPNQPSLLLDSPLEILESIPGSVPEQEKWHVITKLAATCHSLHAFFEPKLTPKILLGCVLKGDASRVKKMLDQDPNLLFIKARASDHTKITIIDNKQSKRIIRTIEASPYQAALGAENMEMLNLMQPYIENKIANGQETACIQFDEQFPNGIIKNPANTYDFTPLMDAIINEQFINRKLNERTEAAFGQFRQDFAPTDVIKTGKHFNMQIYLDALAFYDTHFNQFRNWDQRSLFCKQVIGLLQRLFPTCYAQEICQNLKQILEKLRVFLHFPPNLKDGTFFYDPELGHSHFIHIGSDGRALKWKNGFCGKNHSFIDLPKQSMEQKHEVLVRMSDAFKVQRTIQMKSSS